MKLTPVAAAFAVAVGCVAHAQAQTYPSRPITMIVPFPAGGPTDTLARILGERMRASLGQSVVVENITGAGASIGVGRAAQAAPDGYTINIGNWTSHVGRRRDVSGLRMWLNDLEMPPPSLVSATPLMIVGKSDLPPKDAKELIAWLKANPDKASAATVGAGSGAHVCMLYFQQKTGTSVQLVPYRGGAPVMQDLVAGPDRHRSAPRRRRRLPIVPGGTIKAFAVMSQGRWPALPNVPTMDEVGVSGMYISFWNGLWAPKGTPKDVVAKLNAAVVDAWPIRRCGSGSRARPVTSATRTSRRPKALGAFHKAEIEKWWPIIKAAGIKPVELIRPPRSIRGQADAKGEICCMAARTVGARSCWRRVSGRRRRRTIPTRPITIVAPFPAGGADRHRSRAFWPST